MLIGDGELVLPSFVEKNKIGAVVIDFMPLKGPMSWADLLKNTLPKEVVLCQVSFSLRSHYSISSLAGLHLNVYPLHLPLVINS